MLFRLTVFSSRRGQVSIVNTAALPVRFRHTTVTLMRQRVHRNLRHLLCTFANQFNLINNVNRVSSHLMNNRFRVTQIITMLNLRILSRLLNLNILNTNNKRKSNSSQALNIFTNRVRRLLNFLAARMRTIMPRLITRNVSRRDTIQPMTSISRHIELNVTHQGRGQQRINKIKRVTKLMRGLNAIFLNLLLRMPVNLFTPIILSMSRHSLLNFFNRCVHINLLVLILASLKDPCIIPNVNGNKYQVVRAMVRRTNLLRSKQHNQKYKQNVIARRNSSQLIQRSLKDRHNILLNVKLHIVMSGAGLLALSTTVLIRLNGHRVRTLLRRFTMLHVLPNLQVSSSSIRNIITKAANNVPTGTTYKSTGRYSHDSRKYSHHASSYLSNRSIPFSVQVVVGHG